MSRPDSISDPERLAGLPPLPRDEEGPVFAEPWQAQAFALAVKLSEEGHFTWKEWTAALSDELKAAASRGEPDDGSRYYEHWLAALERLVTAKGLTDAAAMHERKEAWIEAYRRTPHGKPVELAALDRREFLGASAALTLSTLGSPGAGAGAPQSEASTGGSEDFPGFERQDVRTTETVIHTLRGGSGPPVLLLHGYPQTHVEWHKIAAELARSFTVVLTDLRGYGASGKPDSGADHSGYSKRSMAQDQVEVMRSLGHERFSVVGHDRGGRVGHRMALDHPDRVAKLAVIDIVSTYKLFHEVTKDFATAYYHWFFLIQPPPFPETLLANSLDFWMERTFSSPKVFTPAAKAAYKRAMADPETLHAACEDYRAAASIDLVHDEADLPTKIDCPLLVLWGERAPMHRLYDVLSTWRERASQVTGKAMPGGHYLPEEIPEETLSELRAFLA